MVMVVVVASTSVAREQRRVHAWYLSPAAAETTGSDCSQVSNLTERMPTTWWSKENTQHDHWSDQKTMHTIAQKLSMILTTTSSLKYSVITLGHGGCDNRTAIYRPAVIADRMYEMVN